jgi:alkanesulfonate monooxygenase SsuD/methylene tetrahydromethanopterin reductase-like flavin-dependent oxidoreductase (luciferase family)
MLKHKISVLEKHCDDVGRDPAEITRTAFMSVALTDDETRARRLRGIFGTGMSEEDQQSYLAIGTADHIIDVLHKYEAAGLKGIIFQGLPNKAELYARLNEEVLAAFA